MPNLSASSHGSGVHRFAVLVAFCTWLLIIAGALVTGNEAGLSVPDWPLSYGSLMPPMIGGIFYEHGHRMIAATVGLLTVILAIWLWKKESRRAVRLLGWAALGAVVGQGLLGGLTVLLFLPAAVSVAHGCMAQAFFGVVVSLAWVTTPHWLEQNATMVEDTPNVPLRRIATAVTVAVYIQLILGAIVRHSKEDLWMHVIGAGVVALLTVWVFIRVTGMYARIAGLLRPAVLLISLVAVQSLLGLLSFWIRAITRNAVQPMQSAIWITTVHVAVGALVLATSLILTLQAHRLLRSPESAWGHQAASQKAVS